MSGLSLNFGIFVNYEINCERFQSREVYFRTLSRTHLLFLLKQSIYWRLSVHICEPMGGHSHSNHHYTPCPIGLQSYYNAQSNFKCPHNLSQPQHFKKSKISAETQSNFLTVSSYKIKMQITFYQHKMTHCHSKIKEKSISRKYWTKARYKPSSANSKFYTCQNTPGLQLFSALLTATSFPLCHFPQSAISSFRQVSKHSVISSVSNTI